MLSSYAFNLFANTSYFPSAHRPGVWGLGGQTGQSSARLVSGSPVTSSSPGTLGGFHELLYTLPDGACTILVAIRSRIASRGTSRFTTCHPLISRANHGTPGPSHTKFISTSSSKLSACPFVLGNPSSRKLEAGELLAANFVFPP